MKVPRLASAAMIAAALAACAGPQSRIKKHQAEFDTYPPEIQQKIRDGQADVGFTDQQVALALGRPDRIYNRKTAAGEQEVWAYGAGEASQVGIGLGFGMGAGAFAGDVGVASGPGYDYGERLRVVFQNGVVVSVESRRR